MSELLTFGDLKTGSLKKIAQSCADQDAFRILVNDSVRRLMRRGDWASTVLPIFVCIRQGCVVWPRYVGQVRRLNVCNRPIPVQNMWYEFLPGTRNDWCVGGSNWNWIGQRASITAKGRTSVFQDVQGDGRLIRVYARALADMNKVVKIFGTDNNGQPLATRNPDDTFTPGISITIGNPFGSSSVFVRSIDYVLKPETELPINLYAYNATTNLLEDIAQYDASETRPSYERTRLNVTWTNPCTASATPNCCGVMRGVVALVKLAFIPVKLDDDLVSLQNEDAIKLMCQASLFQEAGDIKNFKEFEAAAVECLNRELEDVTPDEQIAVADNVLGPQVWSNSTF